MKRLYEETNGLGFVAKNRFLRSATWENMATDDGHLTQQIYDIYQRLAENEVGTIITGYANVVQEEQPNPGMMGIYDDSFIPEYQKLTELVHKYKSCIVLQIAYGGTKTTYHVGERVILAPSVVPELSTNTVGKEMTIEEIQYIITAFAQAAKRAKKAGFDGVEIHGAHTYLINQFLSPYYNQRTDQYGGSLENRMRFLKEIYDAMRKEVGKEYPIWVKLTATEFFHGGLTFPETREICKAVESWGMNAIELSGNVHGKAKSMVGQEFDGYQIEEEGYFYRYGEIVSNEIGIPVITVGGFRKLESIEEIIEKTNIQYVALSRPLLAEPDLLVRWKHGDKSPAKCIRCSKCRTENGNYCVIFQ